MLSRSFGVYFTIMVPTPSPIDCRAYAKINIGLRVTEKRADGYHEITTVFHRIELFDDITLSPARDVTVVSTDPEVPSGESNICHAAAAMLRQHLGTGAGVRIDVTKRIPAGAGLGGGSADAAAVLRRPPPQAAVHIIVQICPSLKHKSRRPPKKRGGFRQKAAGIPCPPAGWRRQTIKLPRHDHE